MSSWHVTNASIHQLAWLIAFVSSVISDVREGFPKFAWWALVYMFFCIVGVTVAVASDSVQAYHVAVGLPFPLACLHALTLDRLLAF